MTGQSISKPRFKVGDKVQCTDTFAACVTTGTITEILDEGKRYQLKEWNGKDIVAPDANLFEWDDASGAYMAIAKWMKLRANSYIRLAKRLKGKKS